VKKADKMRVEREKDKGYRVFVDTKTDLRELREVVSAAIAGDMVTLTCSDGVSTQVGIGAPGFRSLRRKMWLADMLHRWGSWKFYFAGLLVFLVVYFSALLAIEVVASDEIQVVPPVIEEEYEVGQSLPMQSPAAPPTAEGWRP